MPPKKKKAGPIPVEALRYFEAKKIRPGFNHTDVWKEEHAAAFTIAKVMEEDILEDMRELTERSLKEGKTFRDFQKEAAGLLSQSGWADYGNNAPDKVRIKTIFDTNMRVARSAGQWERIDRTKKTLPFLVYEIGPSARHRPDHVSWAGTTLPVDDPWFDSHYPQNGHGCRCTVRQIGVAETGRRGGPSKRPPSFDVPWKNKKTGKIEQVPVGIQPGFNYHIGKDRLKPIRDLEK